jgi:F-box/leucine-rich repeat protein 2/20
MWSNLDLRAFPRIPPSLLTRLSRSAGTFVKSVDASGHTTLLPSTLLDVTNDLCLKHVPSGQLPHTQLTSINFQGCAALTTRSLHHLLIRSPSLQTIRLKGLTAVTNTTCDVLGVYCAQVTVLDIGRCLNVDGQGIRSFISAGLSRGNHLPLKELRASGLKRVNDEVLATLGKGAPFLEVLDLSYARDLHNSALEAFVSCANNDTQFETVLLTAREAGREPGDTTKYRRRVTRLRHLSLSSCVLLTDIACSNLAHTMPRLEYLELAGIGTELKDDGLIRLLKTTPLIRRLDLEDASDITDTLIAAITPRPVADMTSNGSSRSFRTWPCTGTFSVVIRRQHNRRGIPFPHTELHSFVCTGSRQYAHVGSGSQGVRTIVSYTEDGEPSHSCYRLSRCR